MKYYRGYLVLVVFLGLSWMNKENLFFVFYGLSFLLSVRICDRRRK